MMQNILAFLLAKNLKKIIKEYQISNIHFLLNFLQIPNIRKCRCFSIFSTKFKHNLQKEKGIIVFLRKKTVTMMMKQGISEATQLAADRKEA